MYIQNNTAIPRDWLVAEYLLDGSAVDTAWSNDWTASNVTYLPAERGYVEEVGSFNSNWTVTTWTWIWIWLTAFTVSAFIKSSVADTAERRVLAWLNSWGSNIFYMQYYQNKYYAIAWVWWADWVIQPTSPTPPVWEYVHYLIENNWTNFRMYVNNILVWSDTWSFSETLDKVIIGNNYNWDIWLTRIYNRALNESERTALYQEGLRKLWPTNLLPSPNTKVKDWLVWEWNLNDNALDTSWNWNDWTPSNVTYDPVWWGKVGSFNGSSSYVDSILTSSYTDMSICTVISIDSLPWTNEQYEIIAKWYTVWTDKVNFSLSYYNESGTRRIKFIHYDWLIWTFWITYNINLIVWKKYILIWKRDSSWNYNLYLDWKAVWVTTSVNNSFPVHSDIVWIWYLKWWWRHFNWQIWLTRIYNRALSEQEINQQYQEWLKYIHWNKYSLPNLQQWLVLEISKPQV